LIKIAKHMGEFFLKKSKEKYNQAITNYAQQKI
jgi:hypothetical protein